MMKKLMLGNAALARGFYEAGCKVFSSYPGTPSTEITEEAAKYKEIYCEWAPNEKVAVESAHGASLGGVRAASAMKHDAAKRVNFFIVVLFLILVILFIVR